MNAKSSSLTVLPAIVALSCAACGGTVVTGGAGGVTTTLPSTSSSTSAGTYTTSSSTYTLPPSTSSSSGTGIVPLPPPPEGGLPGSGSVVLALSRLYLGDTDRDGTPDQTNGWAQYGFDLDGKISTATSTDLCKPRNGASPANVYPDGAGGIDNSFGKLILPILLGIASNISEQANARLSSGQYTLLVDLQALGAGAAQNPLLARMYAGANLGHAPLFDGTDLWPVDPASLSSPSDVTSALTQFPHGYLTADTWVGAPPTSLVVQLGVAGFNLPLAIGHATVAMALDATRTSATNGTIAGILPVSSLVEAIQQIAGSIDPELCSSPTITSVAEQITQAADILVDGTQDPAKPCDGISIGLGFDARVVQLGPIGPATPPPPNPCGP